MQRQRGEARDEPFLQRHATWQHRWKAVAKRTAVIMATQRLGLIGVERWSCHPALTPWPKSRVTQQLASRSSGGPIKVFAQDETRLGLLPVVRRRITACGVQPVATVTHQFDNFYLYGAVEPVTGASFFLELPYLNSRAFQRWLDGFSATFPESLNVVVLDNGAGHKAKAVRWPSNVVPVFLPPYSPELNPIERLWRDLKDKLADVAITTIQELSDALCAIIQTYSQATLQSLTSFPYFVQAIATAQQALYV